MGLFSLTRASFCSRLGIVPVEDVIVSRRAADLGSILGGVSGIVVVELSCDADFKTLMTFSLAALIDFFAFLVPKASRVQYVDSDAKEKHQCKFLNGRRTQYGTWTGQTHILLLLLFFLLFLSPYTRSHDHVPGFEHLQIASRRIKDSDIMFPQLTRPTILVFFRNII